MEIAFEHADTFMDDVNNQQAIIDLADFLFSKPDFIKETADVVLFLYNKFELWKIGYLRKKAPNKKIGALREQFTDLLTAVFDLANSPPASETREEYLHRLRGGILEVLVTRTMRERYQYMGNNCHVYLDSEPLKVSEKSENPKTVDVAGVDKLEGPEKGELYECKVGSYFIKKHHLKFIHAARRRLDQKGLDSILASIVSFENKVYLMSTFKKLGFPKQKMISRDYVSHLTSYDKVKALLASQ